MEAFLAGFAATGKHFPQDPGRLPKTLDLVL